MNKALIRLLTIVLMFSFACNGQIETEKPPILKKTKEGSLELLKVREFVLTSDEFNIGVIEPPTLLLERDGDIKILFRDTGLNQILIADSTGFVHGAIGRDGDGPKEFRNISSFGVDNDTIVVRDAALDLVKKFKFDGELVNSYEGNFKDKVWGRSKLVYFEQDKFILGIQEAEKSSENNHWESRTIAIYDRAGNLERVLGGYDSSLIKSHPLYNALNSILVHNGFVYTTHRTSPIIQKFDLETGERVSRFGVLSKNYKVSKERPNATDPREVKNKINVKFSAVGQSFITNDYFAFYFYSLTEKFFELRNPSDKVHFLNLFDNREEFLGEIALPFQPLAMDSSNKLYLLEDDNPDNVLIGVYEIVR